MTASTQSTMSETASPRTDDPSCEALPRVIVTTTASVDGRVSTSRQDLLLRPEVSERWRSGWADDTEEVLARRDRWIADTWAPTVVLEGSGSFVAPAQRSRWRDSGDGHDDPPGGDSRPSGPDAPAPSRPVDHLPRRFQRWFAVVDGRGRVDWTFTGDEQTSLLVLACERTPPRYLAHLRDLEVPYLVRGMDRVDLRASLAAFCSVLGATAVVADGGGGLTAALLAGDLVDELHVVTVPMLVGGAATPSLLDGPGPAGDSRPHRLRVEQSVAGAAGTRWTRYVTLRSASLPASDRAQ